MFICVGFKPTAPTRSNKSALAVSSCAPSSAHTSSAHTVPPPPVSTRQSGNHPTCSSAHVPCRQAGAGALLGCSVHLRSFCFSIGLFFSLPPPYTHICVVCVCLACVCVFVTPPPPPFGTRVRVCAPPSPPPPYRTRVGMPPPLYPPPPSAAEGRDRRVVCSSPSSHPRTHRHLP
jgi:hypothetical protein